LAHRRRGHPAAAAGLTLVALLLSGCGEDESPVSARSPLTVEEALHADADGAVRVRGILIADANEVRLCSAILESYPPQCGQPSLVVRGLDLVGVSNMEQAKGIRWTSREATLVGEVDDGVITISATG
jgi:hypothetical protein